MILSSQTKTISRLALASALGILPGMAAGQFPSPTRMPQVIHVQDLPSRQSLPSEARSLPGPIQEQKNRSVKVEEPKVQRDRAARRQSADFDIQVERIWFENDATFAEVRVWNTSNFEIGEINLHCSAMDANRRELTHHEQKLLAAVIGTMGPGFTTTVKLMLEKGTSQVRTVACTARGF